MVARRAAPLGAERGWGGWDVSPRMVALLAIRRGEGTAEEILARMGAVGVGPSPSSLYAALGRLRAEGLIAGEKEDQGRRGAPRTRWRLTEAGETAAAQAVVRIRAAIGGG